MVTLISAFAQYLITIAKNLSLKGRLQIQVCKVWIHWEIKKWLNNELSFFLKAGRTFLYRNLALLTVEATYQSQQKHFWTLVDASCCWRERKRKWNKISKKGKMIRYWMVILAYSFFEHFFGRFSWVKEMLFSV